MAQLLVQAFFALATTAGMAVAAPADLEVRGDVAHPAHLSVADLQALPVHEVRDLVLVCGTGERKGAYRDARGVLLRDLLDRCGVVANAHDAHNRIYVLATASDGYQAIFSWHELFNSPVGDGVVVLYAQAGDPLASPRGPFALVSTLDLRTGPRQVRQLVSLQVVTLPGR